MRNPESRPLIHEAIAVINKHIMNQLSDDVLQLNMAPDGASHVATLRIPETDIRTGNPTGQQLTHHVGHSGFQAVGKSSKKMRWKTPASELKEYFRHYMPHKYAMDQTKYKAFFEQYQKGIFTQKGISDEIRQAHEGEKLLAVLSDNQKFR